MKQSVFDWECRAVVLVDGTISVLVVSVLPEVVEVMVVVVVLLLSLNKCTVVNGISIECGGNNFEFNDKLDDSSSLIDTLTTFALRV